MFVPVGGVLGAVIAGGRSGANGFLCNGQGFSVRST